MEDEPEEEADDEEDEEEEGDGVELGDEDRGTVEDDATGEPANTEPLFLPAIPEDEDSEDEESQAGPVEQTEAQQEQSRVIQSYLDAEDRGEIDLLVTTDPRRGDLTFFASQHKWRLGQCTQQMLLVMVVSIGNSTSGTRDELILRSGPTIDIRLPSMS